jgi:hypothetical protein
MLQLIDINGLGDFSHCMMIDATQEIGVNRMLIAYS